MSIRWVACHTKLIDNLPLFTYPQMHLVRHLYLSGSPVGQKWRELAQTKAAQGFLFNLNP
jgi:hypothetical protein